jgi:hypothetical protein
MRYIELYCDMHGCNTEFIIRLADGDIHEYYICPICESLVLQKKDESRFMIEKI